MASEGGKSRACWDRMWGDDGSPVFLALLRKQELARGGQYIHDTRLYKQMRKSVKPRRFCFPSIYISLEAAERGRFGF